MKKYIVSSLFLAAVVFSFGMKVSAETNDAASLRLKSVTDVKANIKIAPADVATGSATICKKIDADMNGRITRDDFAAFEKLYNSNNVARADLDMSGGLTANDFMAFQNGYASCTTVKANPGVKPTPTTAKPQSVDADRKVDANTDARSHYRQRLSQLEAMYTKFVRIADLIGKRITELEAQGVKVSEAKASLASARDHLLKAKNAIDTAIKLYTNAGTVNAEVIASAKVAQSELVEARQDLTAATKALRMHDSRKDADQKPALSTACKVLDMNADGSLGAPDFVAFQAAFTANEKRADMDANGNLNANDYMAYINAFAGCIRS